MRNDDVTVEVGVDEAEVKLRGATTLDRIASALDTIDSNDFATLTSGLRGKLGIGSIDGDSFDTGVAERRACGVIDRGRPPAFDDVIAVNAACACAAELGICGCVMSRALGLRTGEALRICW